MTKATVMKIQNARELTLGRTIRLTTYEVIRKASDKLMPTVETLRRNGAVEESALTWGYSEGDSENISAYNEYVGIRIR